jgi:tetratricopeptide (TPR) repeat protein
MQTVVDFFSHYKEVSAFAFSIGALVFSVVAYFQKSKETVRTLRSQLADTIMKLMALNPQITELNDQIDKLATLRSEKPSEAKDAENENRRLRSLRSSYSEQRLALAQMAVFLMGHEEMNQRLISNVEYAAVADAFNGAGEIENSQVYWEKAINASQMGPYKTKLKGQYADFLARRVGFDKAKEMYKRAVLLPDDPSDALLWEVIYIYARWSRMEAGAGHLDDAEALWKKAIDTCDTMKSEKRRQDGHQNVLVDPPAKTASRLKAESG